MNHKDRVKQSITAGGTGALTLGAAVAGYQALVVGDNGALFPYVIEDGAAWETGYGTYTHSGTSFARTSRKDSSTGGALNVTTAAYFYIDWIAAAAADAYSAGGTDVAVADGGTGSSTAAGARTNLGLDTLATQAANAVAITGGTIDGTPIGGTTPAAAAVTTLTVTNFAGTGGNPITSDSTLLINRAGGAIGQLNLRAAGLNTLVVVGGSAGGALPYIYFADPTVGTANSSLGYISSGLLGIGNGSAGSTAGSLSLTNLTASGRVNHASYTVGTLPAAGAAGGEIYVSNEAGGAVLAFSDATNWRRVTDRAIVS